MQRVIQYIFIICAFALSFSSCSKSSEEDEEPQTKLSTIAGTWLEYAYLNSDGYFTDISNTGYNMYYEFAIPNKFTQYSINENGEKEISHTGTWGYSAESQHVYIEEERGWNLDISVEFDNDIKNDGLFHATFDIKGRTPNQSSIIKVKRISQ